MSSLRRSLALVARSLLIPLAIPLVGTLVACAGVGGPDGVRHEPLSAVAPTHLADEVAARSGADCSAEVREQLLEGRRSLGECDVVESAAARATILHDGVRFGVVAHQDVGLHGVRLRLSEARLCRGWPLPTDDDQGVVLNERDADRSGCLLRPYRGQLTLTAVDAEGNRHHAARVDVDRDGAVTFEYAAIDAELRRSLGRGLDAYVWLELGESAWAGTVNLDRLRSYLADWHFQWVAKGRGAPALFAARHDTHPRSADAQAYAVEVRVERQRQDYEAVTAGDMSASTFLERHLWSPYRAAVERLTVSE